ncbi:MAG: response regulator transcription factor [Terracidiphilus sp.]|jgi:DNA-binding NarL/FixJ family response regulator
MSLILDVEPIQIGLATDEPIRLEGFASIFEQPPLKGKPPLLPVYGSIEELLNHPKLTYLVVDLHASSTGLKMLASLARKCPGVRLIVIGPAGNDELVMESIIAGARAYLDSTADPSMVRKAIDEVTGGSIWAPRHLLSKLIDRLIAASDTSLTNQPARLTGRERQVLELILTARSNREIARNLGIEERTVQAHVGRLMRKTGAGNRINLSIRALNSSLLSVGQGDERRQSDRRQGDRRRAPALGPELAKYQQNDNVT